MEIIQRLYPLLKEGFYNSSKVFIITLVVSIVIAILISCARLSKDKLISSLVKTYIYVMRAIPLLLQLMFIFFALPMLPGVAISLDRFPSIYLAFILNYTAYFAEIYRRHPINR